MDLERVARADETAPALLVLVGLVRALLALVGLALQVRFGGDREDPIAIEPRVLQEV